MASKKIYRSTFKAQVVQEVLREEKPVTQIASDHGIHPTVVREWKTIALREWPTLFERQSSVASYQTPGSVYRGDVLLANGETTTCG